MGEVDFKHYGKIQNVVHFPYDDAGTRAIGKAYTFTKRQSKKARKQGRKVKGRRKA